MDAFTLINRRISDHTTRLLAYFDPFDRELTPGRQFLFEKNTLGYLRRNGLISHRFPISLPVEVWGIILWYVLEPTISPHTYCNSDTYPELHLQFYSTTTPDLQDWFCCRLVCRAWKQLLGPYPHITLPIKTSPFKDADTKGITSMSCNYDDLFVEISRDGCPTLLSQLTVLSIQHFGSWVFDSGSPSKFIKFSNVQCLIIPGWGRWSDTWPSLTRGFPKLVSLTIQGRVYCSGEIRLQHLEILGIEPDGGAEVYWDLPSLKHLSLYGPFYPEQLLRDRGPFLYSLLFHTKRLFTSEFWTHYASLRTLGLCPQTMGGIRSPPLEHPLRHLVLFLAREEEFPVQLIKDTLGKFPLIRHCSIQMPGRNVRAKKALQAEYNVSFHFLPQFPRKSKSSFSMLWGIFDIINGWHEILVTTIVETFMATLLPPLWVTTTVLDLKVDKTHPGEDDAAQYLGTLMVSGLIWYSFLYYIACWILGHVQHWIPVPLRPMVQLVL
ncbi:hypothetical protein CPB86DRAFT_869834 [Serendipita vermifera]|nr:hypothetical protein CPB86DRAFT_869834 [Serendipita vermifera]